MSRMSRMSRTPRPTRNPLTILLASLEADLTRNLPRNTRGLAEARARRPELLPFDTLAAIHRSLDVHSSLGIDDRRALVMALVEEAQRGESAVWASLLALGFAPMIQRLRRRLGRTLDTELDSAVLAAFFGAVRSVRVGSYAAVSLRWATEKEVYTRLHAERRLGAPTPFDEDIHSNPVLHEVETQDTLAEMLRLLETEGEAEIMDVLLATRGGDESLHAYVARTCPDPRDRAARYEHLCRARLRFEREIRERLMARAA